jgi:hypothetical protein
MVIKRLIAGILLLSMLLIVGCSGEEDQLTGQTVAQISTLTVKVVHENGTVVPDAKVYVNNEYKGKTSKYGGSKGTETVVLDGSENWIRAEKEGFVSPTPTLVSATTAGSQRMAIVLEKRRSNFEVIISDLHGPLKSADVSLYTEGFLDTKKTDERGKVTFPKVDDGDYGLRVSMEDYGEDVQEITFHVWSEPFVALDVELIRKPRLSVVVLDDEGDNLVGSEVSYYTKKDYNSPGGRPFQVSLSDVNGVALAKDVAYGENYIVVVKKENYVAQTHEINLQKDSQEVSVTLMFDIE